MVTGFKKLSYEERLKRLKLYSLERRRMRGDLIETYKLLTGKEDIDYRQFFQKAETGQLRGNSMKLYKKNVKLELRRNFFSQRVVEKWNMLPEDIVSAPSITSFKKKLDVWMERDRH